MRLLIVAALLFSTATIAVGEDLDAPDPSIGEKPQGYVYKNDYFSIMFGGGVLVDYVHFWQDADSDQQMKLFPEMGIRDFRVLASGATPWKRLTYTVGYLYDGAKNSWRFRQTGLKLQVDEASGFLFIGRTKEGFSTNKLMVGYYGWMNERATANDAFIPILNDGLRWTGFAGRHFVYDVGAFSDVIGYVETYNKNDWAFVGRAVWLPFGAEPDSVLHLATEIRYAGANDGQLVYKSKPEAFFAQSQAVDTGKFDASRSTIIGAELYFTRGPFSSGGEYFWNKVSSDSANDPLFHGGEVFAAYLLTGETHPYNPKTGVFGNVVPTKSFFDNGWGAWELAARGSYVDLDSETIKGGRFARISTQLNWYVSQNVRLEAVYGYGVLDRMNVTGETQFFQTRVQLAIK